MPSNTASPEKKPTVDINIPKRVTLQLFTLVIMAGALQ
ncbi:hypothetical protein SAMN06297358_1238 [Pedobacter xixiisoli]|uniref:Uncharacterized protein n=1 Tax=Pedobacter xixiisoli TaxID=1476464 RepID=A0A285ZVW3_9SPHI|nr:hypothetical protein SAMN06297358_1238 [Pedobacter xixiisoli]